MKKYCFYVLMGLLLVCGFWTIAGAVDMMASLTAVPAGAAQSAAVPARETPEAKPEIVDLNTATVAELKTLPWIGEIYSKSIIKGRPYASKDDFAARHVIPSVTYEKLKDRIKIGPQGN